MDKMHLIVFQHTPEEPMGYFETICRQWKIPFDYIRLFETNEVPKIVATHVLIMGGPMSVNDETDYPYLAEEKKIDPFISKIRHARIRHLPWRTTDCKRFWWKGVSMQRGNRLAGDSV